MVLRSASALRALAALLLTLQRVEAQSIRQFRLVYSGDIRGAIFPVDATGAQARDANFESCSLFGGAARREAQLAAWRVDEPSDVIAVDGGSYFFGSGTSYYAFDTSASAHFFTRFGYDAASLRYLDLAACGDDKAAQWVDAVTDDTSIFVVSNFDATSPSPLSGRVASWRILEDEATGAIRAGFLGLMDDAFVDETTRNRLMDRVQSVAAAREELRREAEERGVCRGNADIDDGLLFPIIVLSDVALDAGLRDVLERVEGIDLAVTVADPDAKQASTEVTNWFGDSVVVATLGPGAPRNGRHLGSIVIDFDATRGIVENYAVEVVELTCHVANATGAADVAHAQALDVMLEYWGAMNATLGATVATLETGIAYDKAACRTTWCPIGSTVAGELCHHSSDSSRRCLPVRRQRLRRRRARHRRLARRLVAPRSDPVP